MKKTIYGAIAAAIAMISVPAAAATSVTGTVTGPNDPELVEFFPGTDGNAVGLDGQNSPDLFYMREQTNVAIPLSGIAGITPGTLVDSFYVWFDPVNSPATTLNGTVTFGREILGIILTTNELNASDAFFARGDVDYSSNGFRGLEFGGGGDSASFSGNTLDVTFRATSPGDYIRVLTAAVPEPSTWLMLLLGFGLIGGAMRAQRENQGVQAKFAI